MRSRSIKREYKDFSDGVKSFIDENCPQNQLGIKIWMTTY